MIARSARARSGITLTEILISILIMGVGLISLATLFPLGLLRLREATRNSRAGLAFETAGRRHGRPSPALQAVVHADLVLGPINKQKVPRDPFVQDALADVSMGDGTAAGGDLASGNVQIPANNVGLTSRPAVLLRPALAVDHRGHAAARGWPTRPSTFSCLRQWRDPPTRPGSGPGSSPTASSPFIRTDPDGRRPQRLRAPAAHQLHPLEQRGGLPEHPVSRSPTTNCEPRGRQPAAGRGGRRLHLDRRHRLQLVRRATPNLPSPLVPDMSAGAASGRLPVHLVLHRPPGRRRGQRRPVLRRGRRLRRPTVRLRPARPASRSTPRPARRSSRRSSATASHKASGATGFATGRTGSSCSAGPPSMPDPQVRVGGWICDVTYERNRGTGTRLASSPACSTLRPLLLVSDRQADRRRRPTPCRRRRPRPVSLDGGDAHLARSRSRRS